MDLNPDINPGHSSSLDEIEKNGFELANLATKYDEMKSWDAALFYYKECTSMLLKALEMGSKYPNLTKKISDYMKRCEYLADSIENQNKQKFEIKAINQDKSSVARIEFLIREAFGEDEEGNKDNAAQLYMEAVETVLKITPSIQDQKMLSELNNLAAQAISRAEDLKRSHANIEKHLATELNNLKLNTPTPVKAQNTAEKRIFDNKDKLIVVGSSSYTKEELQVIRKTSFINTREYVPFLSFDLKERFAYPLPYKDPTGLLILSPKQKKELGKWVRLDELCENPKIIKLIDCFSIKQTLVSDCSFVASLTVSALYEKRFKKKLVTSIIYPQNRSGEPCYNPCGKYMIKFHINGVKRKVIIDDYLPVDRRNSLLCSHSVNYDEFWVSLLEKAYMKVMGGYDFPGSSSNIDLHALTGWIPERISLKDPDKNIENLFSMLTDRYHKGDVLMTVATGTISEDLCDKAGLVPNHAYALLDLRFVEGKFLLLLKNPWRHLRWKGNFSERDTKNWTPSMKKALHYDPENAKNFDNGVFWIDSSSFCKFFDVIYMNWNPSMFKYTFCTHGQWDAGLGPAKDLYNIGDNPQFCLDVKENGSTVWILLTRHIVDRNDFADNKEFISLLVYKGGEKVYLPFDPPPFIDGVRINSPHYLCKLVIPKNQTTLRYTLVISQYEKSTTIFYSLRVFSTCIFNLTNLKELYKYKQEVKNGEWTEKSAGGCLNNRETYSKNPVYQLEVCGPNEEENTLLIDLKGPKVFNVGFDIVAVSIRDPKSPHYFSKATSGNYRSGLTILKIDKVPPGLYNIIPSTFYPGEKGPFFLTVKSTSPIKLNKIK